MSFPVTPRTIDDTRQRGIVLAVTLLAIAIDGAAEPATGGIASSIAASFGGDESFKILASAGFSVAYDLAVLCSLWLIANHGKRGYFRGSLLGYAIASLACACAPTQGIFIGARILEGACLGGLFASALLTMVGVSPPQRLPFVFALFTIIALAAPELAPLIAALVSHAGGWRSVFVALAILPLIGGIVANLFMKDVEPPKPAQFDTGSFLAMGLFLTAFHVATENAAMLSLRTAGDVALIGICVLSALWFIVRETRFARTPFVDLRPFSNRLISQGLLTCVLLGVVLGGSVSLVTFAIAGWHVAPLVALTISSTSFLGACAGTYVVYRIWISHLIDNKRATILGLTTVALCYGVESAFASQGALAPPLAVVLAIVCGFGLALTIGPLASLLFDAVPHDQFGALALLFKIALIIGSAFAVPAMVHLHGAATLWATFGALLVVSAALIATSPIAEPRVRSAD